MHFREKTFSHGSIFRMLQHFASFTKFEMLFLAAIKDLP